MLFGHEIYLGIVDLNIGILALFAITALSVYGVALAGWSSNSKYPLLGGLRSSAQMVSYELALTMSVVGVLLMAGSFNLRDIVNAQAIHPERGIFGWNIFPQILGLLCFFVAAIAETNRVPFDLAGSGIGTGRWISHGICELQVRDVFHRGIHQHDHRIVPLRDHVLRRLAVSLPRCVDVHALSAVADSDSVRAVGDLGRHPLRNDLWAHHSSGRRHGHHASSARVLISFPVRQRIHPGAVLAAGQDFRLPFRVRVDARHAAALPL